MLESLRGLGYTTATALADLIDNSVAAEASVVDLLFRWNGTGSTVSVLDDGCGMDASALDKAMRLGERSPRDLRAIDDLGRFGLGLKTASFSQCRRLTVASRTAGGLMSCLRWDLDFIESLKDGGWYLLEGPHPGSESLLEPLARQPRGSIVVWECLDRIVTAGFTEQDFLDLIDRIQRHLAMVFHRYLGTRGRKLTIQINGRAISPWDPFLADHSATWSSPVETIPTPDGPVVVQGHVLPHRDRLSAQLHESAAGPEGWTAQQGFYVYRNERLLLAGGWLGLGRGRVWTREEAHRLARIRLDIPNSADAEWKIDIRKSTARIPVMLRPRLTTLAEDVRDRARRVFAHRGHVKHAGQGPAPAQAWVVQQTPTGTRYRIDRKHPAVRTVLEDGGRGDAELEAMLRMIEETVPLQRVWLDTAEGRDVPRAGFNDAPTAEVSAILDVMYRNLVRRRGLTPTAAREQLLRTEPFDSYPQLVMALPDNPFESIA